jgi:hypothetical protein
VVAATNCLRLQFPVIIGWSIPAGCSGIHHCCTRHVHHQYPAVIIAGVPSACLVPPAALIVFHAAATGTRIVGPDRRSAAHRWPEVIVGGRKWRFHIERQAEIPDNPATDGAFTPRFTRLTKSPEQPIFFASPTCVSCCVLRSSAIRRPSFFCSMVLNYHARARMATQLNDGRLRLAMGVQRAFIPRSVRRIHFLQWGERTDLTARFYLERPVWPGSLEVVQTDTEYVLSQSPITWRVASLTGPFRCARSC